MRSRASWRGHPVHPALIPFPIAFLTGALGFDLAGAWSGAPGLATTASQLAALGVVTGLVAAVPGLIDLLGTVPPRSSGRRRGLVHAAAMVSAVVLFAVGWLMRRLAPADPAPPVLALEALGVVALLFGGWHGGVLVNRNQIGVDHRYAGAGRWREARLAASGGGALVAARSDELGVGQMKLLHVGDRRIVLARTESGYVAFDDRCSHRGGSLAGGTLACGVVQCPWHGSQFEVATGKVRAGPAVEPVATYAVEERGGEVRLSV